MFVCVFCQHQQKAKKKEGNCIRTKALTEKCGTSVGDASDRRRSEGVGAKLVARGSEGPVARRVVHVGICDFTIVLAVVNEAEIICTSFGNTLAVRIRRLTIISICLSLSRIRIVLTSTSLQIGREDGRVKPSFARREERARAIRTDRVERVKAQAQQAINIPIFHKLRRHGRGQLDALVLHCIAANGDDIGHDGAAGRAAVAIADGPGGAADVAGRGGLRGPVDGLPLHRSGGRAVVEDPEVRRARVDVQIQRLGWGIGHKFVVRQQNWLILRNV